MKTKNPKDRKASKDSKVSKDIGIQSEDLNKQFHPAFCDAMTQILEKDTAHYKYEREYNLNSMPNRIDLLVIRKDTDIPSVIGLGQIFKTYNVFEYKSPNQQLSVNEYFRTMAYAYLYAGNLKRSSMEDITISFVREGKPKNLLMFFREQGFRIKEYEKGIYHVKKPGHVDMQVVVTGEIDDEYIWLKALTNKLTFEKAQKLAEEAEKENDTAGRQRVCSILDLVARLNEKKDWMKEVKSMGAFRDLFKEEFEEKDRKIQDLSNQLQNKDEQLQSKDEQLHCQEEQLHCQEEQVNSLKNEIKRLKSQLKKNKIAMF